VRHILSHLQWLAVQHKEINRLREDDAVNGYHFVSVGARYGSVERNATATFDTRVHAVGIGGRWRSLYASFTANRWRP
jgi:hypothetical protein